GRCSCVSRLGLSQQSRSLPLPHIPSQRNQELPEKLQRRATALRSEMKIAGVRRESSICISSSVIASCESAGGILVKSPFKAVACWALYHSGSKSGSLRSRAGRHRLRDGPGRSRKSAYASTTCHDMRGKQKARCGRPRGRARGGAGGRVSLSLGAFL